MFNYDKYLRAASLEEAYELYQKKNNIVIGGMLWLKMQNRKVGTVIDLVELGLDKIEENDDEFSIGAYVSLRDLEKNEALNKYTNNAIEEAVKHIVGVQFRNVATAGGSIYGRYGFSDVLSVFLALDAKVELYKEGIIPIQEFIDKPRNFRDILVRIIVPKTTERIVYLSQRNTSTDFPVLTCCLAINENGYAAVIGARPALAKRVFDETGILNNINDDSANEFADYVASKLTFGSNMRAGAEYREIICKNLIKRGLKMLEVQDER